MTVTTINQYFWPLTSLGEVIISARDWQHVRINESVSVPMRKVGLITTAPDLMTKGIFIMNAPVIVREPFSIPVMLTFYNAHHRSAKLFAGEKIAELILMRV